ncbi:hypothetical protein RJT34_14753 [Clitoria ternatea]|uniref:Protein kinase domain-containing protein n=1 Tax=Clitoria ternatea TaxID=43366 RepID=A0AAN9JT29_CLITE
MSMNPLSPTLSGGDHQGVVELGKDSVPEEVDVEKTEATGRQKAQSYVSHSAVALRCRASSLQLLVVVIVFHAITLTFMKLSKLGEGTLLKRIDGCFNAVKHIPRQLRQETERLPMHLHEKGIAHLDVKSDNIYVKNGVDKLGDFGCATLVDNSLLIEEGDARYMPQEILNENYDHLDKVDIFSLGASIYELIGRLPLPESGCLFSLQLQNLLKVLMDLDPAKRPSARELRESPIFTTFQRTAGN